MANLLIDWWKGGNVVLFERVKKGDLDYIKTVAADVLLDARDEKGRTVLSAATEENKFDCCKEILKKCPSLLYLRDSDTKYTVLHQANFVGKYMFFEYFLSVGLDAATREGNMQAFVEWMELKDRKRYTCLAHATMLGNVHTVKRLVEVDREYKLDLLQMLSDCFDYSKTALEIAVICEHHEIVKLMTDEGDPYSDYIPYSIAKDLLDRVKEGDLDYIKTVTPDVLLKARDENGLSALSIATTYDEFDCCKEILKRCPIILYEQNKVRKTILHHAVNMDYNKNGIYRLVDLFVGVGLEAATIKGNVKSNAENMQRFKNWINFQDSCKETALHDAVRTCNHDIVKRFLQVDRQSVSKQQHHNYRLFSFPQWNHFLLAIPFRHLCVWFLPKRIPSIPSRDMDK